LTEEYGVIAIFVFRTKCAIGATLEQSERFGTRGQRVIAKIEGCRRKLQADQPFKPYDPADCGTYQTLIGTE
jgi:hypothetical protein